MKLHLNPQLFKQSIEFTAQQMNIPAIYVEKDYWVTLVLHAIYQDEIGKDIVFKGGTALSKCFGIIERFSEDIDLIVIRHEGDSGNKLTNKIKNISAFVSKIVPEVNLPEVTQKMGMNRKTAHTYSKEFSGNYGQIRDVIIVEATWLGYYEPYTTTSISSFIYQMMQSNNQLTLAEEFDLSPFEVLTLEPIRTFCEKIMSLVRFSYTEEPMGDLKKKIRHTYDLHYLLQEATIEAFFNSINFDEMLLKVANDDVISFKNNNTWLLNHPSKALIWNNTDEVWSSLKEVYNTEFKNLVFGNLPDDQEVLKSLKIISNRLSKVNWNITIA
jgi:hypothetical protein